MKVFLSHASESRPQAEEIQRALLGAGREFFFDRARLPAGGDCRARIKASVDDAELFVLLVSPDAVAAGGCALTEMGYAPSRWPHPEGHVLPVVIRPTPFDTTPAYLKSVTELEPSGDAAAAKARERAVALKKDFDRRGLTHQGRPLVAVIRPPLTRSGDRLAYGLTKGLLQPIGQVRVTFSAQEADALCDALPAARKDNAAAQRVINRNKSIYKVAGTGERQETPTPSGVCGHVEAP